MQATPRNPRREATPSRGLATQTTITIMVIIILTAMAWLLTPETNDTPEASADTSEARSVVTPPDAAITPSGAARQTPAAPDIPVLPATIQTAEPLDTALENAGGMVDATEAQAQELPPVQSAPTASTDSAESSASDSSSPAQQPPGGSTQSDAASTALTLENSDAALKSELAKLTDGAGYAGAVLANSNLIQRGAAAIDNLRRGLVPNKLFNLSPPRTGFAVRKNNAGQTVVDPVSYSRYDAAVSGLLTLSPEALAGIFHRFRSLLETAYAELGYPAQDMDNALIAALDQVLATPVVEGEPELKRYEAVWIYADDSLEQRSLLHKQLMRTGPDNLRRIKAWASALRETLLNP